MDSLIQVRVRPHADKCEVEQMPDGTLKVSVKALAEHGSANKEVVRALSRHFGTPVEIVRGLTSRTKYVRIG